MSGTSSHQKNGPDEGASISPLARFFFIRPVFAILLTFMLVVSGLMAYQSIVKEAAPDRSLTKQYSPQDAKGAEFGF